MFNLSKIEVHLHISRSLSALFFTLRVVQERYPKQFKCATRGSSGELSREVQVVARSSSGILTRHFRKLDRDTRLKVVQVH
jgi:hypothetical protein